MADNAHIETDKRLERMEKRLKQIYSEAEKDIVAKADEYFKQFAELDKKKWQQVQDGKLTEYEYGKWRKNKIMYGERWARERDRIVAQLTDVRKTALAYINGELPEVYSLNYNYIGTNIGGQVKGYSFDLVNADTVRNLASEDQTFLPYKEVNLRKYQQWCTPKVNSAIMAGIISGDSIPNLAKRLTSVTSMDRGAAVRNARTMVTSAENKARQDGFERATNNGIIIKREWIAAIDNRTRHAHALLDGQLADVNEPFDSELGDIMYPGDPAADPANVYNCRCTLGSKIIGFEKQDGSGVVLISDDDSGIIEREHEKSPRKQAKGDFGVDWSRIQTDEYRTRLSRVIDSDKTLSAVETRVKWALNNRDGVETEELYAIDLESGEEIARIVDQHFPSRVERSPTFTERLNEADKLGKKILLIHNHPRGLPPSISDINALMRSNNVSGITAGHDGSLYYYTRPRTAIDAEDWNIALRHFNKFSQNTAEENALTVLSEKYGFTILKL